MPRRRDGSGPRARRRSPSSPGSTYRPGRAGRAATRRRPAGRLPRRPPGTPPAPGLGPAAPRRQELVFATASTERRPERVAPLQDRDPVDARVAEAVARRGVRPEFHVAAEALMADVLLHVAAGRGQQRVGPGGRDDRLEA